MRRLLAFCSICLLACAAPLVAQIDLGTQVKGQLPPANATGVIGQATSNAIAAVYAAGSSSAAGMKRGARAMHGFTERFSPDMHCAPGTTNANGFDQTTGNPCATPGLYHGSFDLERTLSFGVTNNQPPSPTHFALSFSSTLYSNSSTYVGLSTCPVGTFHCGTASEIGVKLNSAGISLVVGGTAVATWSGYGNGPGSYGTTDAGTYNGTASGWGPPVVSAIYGLTLTVPGDGTAIISAMPPSGNLCQSGSCSWVERVPLTMPAGSLHQIFVRDGGADYIGDVAYAGGYPLAGGSSVVYDIATGPQSHVGRMLRWALDASGNECNYAAITSACSNVFAVLPPNFNPDAPNPFAVQVRGQEQPVLGFFSTFVNTAQTLYQAGFVQAYGDFHGRRFYGATPNLVDMAAIVSILQSSLSLAPRPYFEGDSAAGINILDAISHGFISPLAVICYSCNLSLNWDANLSAQMPFVETDYGFQVSSQYAAYTSPSGQVSYDPLLAVQTLGTGQNLLTSVPMLLIADSSGGDATVDVNFNSTAYAAAANAVRPGIVTINYVGGGHVSSNKFNGAQALAFFNQH